MCAPQPKAPDAWRDTWFSGAADWRDEAALINLSDRRMQMLGHYDYSQHTPPLTISSDLDGFS
jgi:hypothetical protein